LAQKGEKKERKERKSREKRGKKRQKAAKISRKEGNLSEKEEKGHSLARIDHQASATGDLEWPLTSSARF